MPFSTPGTSLARCGPRCSAYIHTCMPTRGGHCLSLRQEHPSPLRCGPQVVDYFEYYWRTVGSSCNEKEILDGLPIKMRMALAMAIHRRLIDEVPIFGHLCAKGPRTNLVCTMLLRMKPMIAQPDDQIVACGQHPKGLFLLVGGLCSSWGRASSPEFSPADRFLTPGDFFGTELLTQSHSLETVVAQIISQLMVLLTSDFTAFLTDFPDLEEEILRCKQTQDLDAKRDRTSEDDVADTGATRRRLLRRLTRRPSMPHDAQVESSLRTYTYTYTYAYAYTHAA